MKKAKVVTREVDIHSFQSGIFFSNADLFSPVSVRPINFGFQSLKNFFEEQKTIPSQWSSYAGPAGIGQYSLREGIPAGVLARFDVYFRSPTKEEMEYDFNIFGEQVLGPSVKEASEEERKSYENNEMFKFWGENHYYLGPPRIVKGSFLTRVFQEGLPNDISELVAEVDSFSEDGNMISSQGYQFIHAESGRMQYLPFRKVEDYNTLKLKFFGLVELIGKKMYYYPNEDKSLSIDFTEALCRINSDF